MAQLTTAKLNTGESRDIDERQLVCFKLADEEFGVDINTIREIVRVPEITYIPRAPNYVRGIANLRGNVLPIIDGRRRLFLPDVDLTERTRVLILDINGISTGILVDAVSEVMRVSASDEDPPPAVTQGGVDNSFLNGVVKLNQGKRLILTIRPEEVLNIDVSESKQKERTEALSTTSESEAKTQQIDERQLVSFVVGDEEYAFDIGVVKEILRLTEITAVPNAPAHVRGLITVRNVLLPILNLRTMLNMEETDAEDQRVLVVEINGFTVGLMVDRVNEVLRVPISLIDATPQLASNTNEIESVAQLNDGKRLILILNLNGLIDISQVSSLVDQKETEQSETQQVKSAQNGNIDEKQLVTFKLEDEEYGFEITEVQEINRLGDVTRMPKAPDYVSGVTNLRGQVVPLINLRQRFLLSKKETDDRTRIIIVDLNGNRTGIIVDQVNEVLRLSSSDIEPTPQIVTSGDAHTEFMTGICKVDNGKRMILLLDTEKLLTVSEKKVLENLSNAKSDNSDFKKDVKKGVPPTKKKLGKMTIAE
ncbi:MAG: chemotaxis protein CheW [Desulfobacterales bacterium]|nr:chemotaxis protein CheW [Desulfobacterales bacterium]